MKKKIVVTVFMSVFLLLSLLGTRLITPTNASVTHHVFLGQSIQEAINSAQPGDTILVHVGTYYLDFGRPVIVNKTVSLIGEDRSTTIIDGNYWTPIIHITANNVTIRSLTIRNGGRIFGVFGGGIYITNSNRNKIVDNIITDTQYGINLERSARNIIIGNDITANDVGIQFLDDYSSNSTIYHNNFINNEIRFDDGVCNNTWDNGYPSGGNYWSDHNPPDIYSGPHQNETGSDGIGDIPYVIEGNNTDRYPLIYPYGFIPSIDVNGNGRIDITDIVLIALAYGSRAGDPGWNPYADLNQDGKVTITDIVMVALHFGEQWMPYVPSSQMVDLRFWMLDGISYINVSIVFAHSAFKVSWGTVVKDGYEIGGYSKIWEWTGIHLCVITTLSHTFSLGPLEGGNYTFTFMVWNEIVESINFTILS